MPLPDPLVGSNAIADVPQWTLDLRLALIPVEHVITPSTGWEGVDPVQDVWRAHVDYRGFAETLPVALRRTSGNNLTLNAGTGVIIATALPPALEPAANVRPYYDAMIRSNVTDGGALIYYNAPGNEFRVIASVTTTLTGGSGSQYLLIPPMRWKLANP